MRPIWLVLFFQLISAIQPYQTTKYQGLIRQETSWDCGSATVAALMVLAGEAVEPRLEAAPERGTPLSSLVHYLRGRGLEVEAYELTWGQLLYFFENFPNRPLIAHKNLAEGHYILLLGMVQDLLVVADPAAGIQAVEPCDFLADFSGYTLYFPSLPPLSAVEKILESTNNRLRLLKQAVAER